MKLQPSLFNLLVVIVNRGKGEAVVETLQSLNVNLNIISFGEGTAPSNLYNVLNYSQEKEIILTVVETAACRRVLDLVNKQFLTTEKNAGIAFTIPLKSMTSNTVDVLHTFNKKAKRSKK